MWAETLNSKYKLHKKERKSWFYDVRRTWDVENLGLDLSSTMCLNSIYLSATRRIYQALGGSTEILHVEFLFLSVIPLRSILVFHLLSIIWPFLLMEWYFILQIYQTLFFCSSSEGDFGCFHFLAIRNRTTMDIPEQLFMWKSVFFFFFFW